MKLYPMETRIVIRRHSASVAALSKKLFGTRPESQVFRGMRDA